MSAAAPGTCMPTQAKTVSEHVQSEDGLVEAYLLAAEDAGDEEVTDLTRRLKAWCVCRS